MPLGWKSFWTSRRGGVAVLAAVTLPAVLLISLGALDLRQVVSDKQLAQEAADNAALMGAQQMGVTPVGAEDRAEAFALAQLQDLPERATVTITATRLDGKSMKVEVSTHRQSFFMNLLPPGGFHTHSESIAVSEGVSPLCVLVFGTDSSHKTELSNTSRLAAPACLVHANERIEVAGSASLQAEVIETSTSASGPMTPSASTGAPVVEDPFEDVDIDGPLLCLSLLSKQIIATNTTLAPGAHCRDVEVKEGITLTLAPGEHYFAKELKMLPNSRLTGADVVVIVGPGGSTKWKDSASVTLRGRKSGRLAGFVVVAARNRLNELLIEADNIDELTGTVYVPRATLNIEGLGQAAQASDWTVMAAQALKLTNNPLVQINADYSGSDVPVPNDVGSNSVGVRLTK